MDGCFTRVRLIVDVFVRHCVAVRYFLEQHEGELQRPSRVSTAASLARALNYENKQLIGAMIVAGWDEALGGQAWACPIGGTLSRQPWATDGSGSTYIWGYLDEVWKEGMTREEAEKVVVEALSLAMARDGSSGGVVRTVSIDKDGAVKKLHTPESHYRTWDEMPEPRLALGAF